MWGRMSFSKITVVFSCVVAPLFGNSYAGFANALRGRARCSQQRGRLLRGGLGQGIAPVGCFLKVMLLASLGLTAGTDRAFSFSGSATGNGGVGVCNYTYTLNSDKLEFWLRSPMPSIIGTPGGTYWATPPQQTASPTITSYNAISKADLAQCIGTIPSNIANFEQNGADGSFATDEYVGFAFKLTTAVGSFSAGWHEYKVGTGTLIPDTTAPTVSIVVADTTLNAGETSLVTFTFSEAVTGFTNSDITFANGTLSAVSSSDSGITWTATFTPTAATADTTNVITVDMTGVMDLAQNTGVGSTDSNNYAIDTAGPTVTVVVADTSLAAGETSLVTFTFSEPVMEFTNDDVTIANGTLSPVSSSDGGTVYTATLTPTAALTDATNVITVAMTGVTDAAGNTGSGTTDSNNYAIDTAGPTVTVVVADTPLAAGETSLVTFTFSEPVTGFSNDDLTIANGTLSAVSSSDGGTVYR